MSEFAGMLSPLDVEEQLKRAAEQLAAQTKQGQAQAAQAPQATPTDPSVARPPKDEVELSQRKAGWQDFLDRLQTDPATRRAALAAAATLSNRKPGQSTLGAMTSAANVGFATYDKEQEGKAKAQRQAEQDELARRQAEQSMAASQQSVKASQSSEVRGTSAEARAVAEEQRRAQAAPLDIRQKDAAVRLAEANASPEKLALDTREAEARLAYTKVLQAKAGKEAVTPATTQLEVWKNSSEGQIRPGETPQAHSIRGYDWLLSQAKDANAGTNANIDLGLMKRADDPLNRDDAGVQAEGQAAAKRLAERRKGRGDSTPGKTSTGLVEGARGTSKSGKAIVVRNGKWEYL